MSAKQRRPMQTRQDLFVHELSGIQRAERLIGEMLEEAQGLVQNPHLKDGLRMHAEQTRRQAERLDQIFRQLGEQPRSVRCHAVRGLHRDLQDVQQSDPSPQVLEGVVAGGAAKTEHYEIAAYTGLVATARAMGQTQAAQLLEQSLHEEQAMLRRVEQIAREVALQATVAAAIRADQESGATAP